MIRRFLCLLLGSAAVVGFETTFGLSKWKPWQPEPRAHWSVLPGKVVYTNRTIRTYMDVAAIRDRNMLLTVDDYAGAPVVSFRGVPIKTDA